MNMNLEISIFIIYAGILLIIYFFGKLLIVPMKIIMKLVVNSILGGIALVLINILGADAGVFLPVNIVTALIAGVLGIPGVIMLILYFHCCL